MRRFCVSSLLCSEAEAEELSHVQILISAFLFRYGMAGLNTPLRSLESLEHVEEVEEVTRVLREPCVCIRMYICIVCVYTYVSYRVVFYDINVDLLDQDLRQDLQSELRYS